MRLVIVRLTVILFGVFISLPVFTDDDHVQLITDQLTNNECSACHFSYPASMLPEASWKKIMGNLENHFGEDASLDDQTTQHITKYLVAHAGDTEFRSSKFVRGLNSQNPPIRITETNYWIRQHPAISKENLQSGLAGLKSNCAVCHLKAENGYYEKY
ncbi:MAG: diheme cytochrome c [Gammaproteobacteria bacterium]|nr:diheme cytochrome c [Gammaproteobacteria bacterium]